MVVPEDVKTGEIPSGGFVSNPYPDGWTCQRCSHVEKANDVLPSPHPPDPNEGTVCKSCSLVTEEAPIVVEWVFKLDDNHHHQTDEYHSQMFIVHDDRRLPLNDDSLKIVLDEMENQGHHIRPSRCGCEHDCCGCWGSSGAYLHAHDVGRQRNIWIFRCNWSKNI